MVSVVPFILTLALAFLLGSIPSGILIGRLFYGIDIREVGSGNIGTTNAIRAMGKKGGYAVFLLDFGKGVLAGLGALGILAWLVPYAGEVDLVLARPEFLAAAFLGCTLGHIFCPWLGFKGGKGIAVAVGCLFVTYGPLGAIIELAIFAVIVIATKYVSAGSIAAAAACWPLACFFFWGHPLAIAMCCLAAGVVIWAHRENIVRLKEGTERKIGG